MLDGFQTRDRRCFVTLAENFQQLKLDRQQSAWLHGEFKNYVVFSLKRNPQCIKYSRIASRRPKFNPSPTNRHLITIYIQFVRTACGISELQISWSVRASVNIIVKMRKDNVEFCLLCPKNKTPLRNIDTQFRRIWIDCTGLEHTETAEPYFHTVIDDVSSERTANSGVLLDILVSDPRIRTSYLLDSSHAEYDVILKSRNRELVCEHPQLC